MAYRGVHIGYPSWEDKSYPCDTWQEARRWVDNKCRGNPQDWGYVIDEATGIQCDEPKAEIIEFPKHGVMA